MESAGSTIPPLDTVNLSRRSPISIIKNITRHSPSADAAVPGSDGRYHYLYRTVDPATGMAYFGKHSDDNFPNDYIGSGKWICEHEDITRLEHEPLEFFDCEAAAYEAERTLVTLEFIADHFVANECEGGIGFTSATMKAVHARPEYKAKLSAAAKRTNADPIVIAKISDGLRRAYTRSEYKMKMIAAVKAAWARPEYKAKHRAAMKEANARPEYKAKHRAAMKETNSRPEYKAKLSVAAKAAWARRKAIIEVAANSH